MTHLEKTRKDFMAKGYINTLRQDTHDRRQKFEPLFMSVIKKKGKFLLSESSFEEYKKECLASGQSFTSWLMQNNLAVDKDGNSIKIFSTTYHFAQDTMFNK